MPSPSSQSSKLSAAILEWDMSRLLYFVTVSSIEKRANNGNYDGISILRTYVPIWFFIIKVFAMYVNIVTTWSFSCYFCNLSELWQIILQLQRKQKITTPLWCNWVIHATDNERTQNGNQKINTQAVTITTENLKKIKILSLIIVYTRLFYICSYITYNETAYAVVRYAIIVIYDQDTRTNPYCLATCPEILIESFFPTLLLKKVSQRFHSAWVAFPFFCNIGQQN